MQFLDLIRCRCAVGRLLFACLLAGWCSPLSAQDSQERVHVVRHLKSNQASKRGIGSAKALSGRVVICHVFCDDDQSSWQAEEKRRVLELTQQAFRFIRLESLQHNRFVTFVERTIGPVRAAERISTDPMADPNWTETLIKQASGKSGVDLVLGLKGELNADSVIVCLHVNKAALSYNLAYYDNVAIKFAAERMVCFTKYPDQRPTAAATYAHEILHLYGAGDLYFPYDITPQRKLRAGELFPNDVMYRVDYNLAKLNVGPFTAFRVGWTNQLDQRFRVFEDD